MGVVNAAQKSSLLWDRRRWRGEGVVGALRGIADHVRQYASLSEIDCATLQEAAGVVVMAVDQTPTQTMAAAIREFRSSDPATALMLCFQTESRSIHELATLARAGLDEIARVDEPAALTRLRQIVLRSLHQSLPVDLVRQVMPAVAVEPAAICGFCFRHAFVRLQVREVANWFSCDETTLNRRLRSVGLRSAEHIIDLARLLHAALWLDWTIEKVHVIARQLGYPSASAFTNYVVRWTGRSPSSLRENGAIHLIGQHIRNGALRSVVQ